MTGQESRDQEEEENQDTRENREKIGIQADKAVDCGEGERVGRFLPGEETDQPILEDEGNTDSVSRQVSTSPK